MVEENIQIQINELNKKLDVILEEVYAQGSHRKFKEDFQADLAKIIDGVVQLSTKRLEEISEYFSMEDLLYLIKKLLSNINNLVKSIELLNNVMDFNESFAPLAKEMMTAMQVKLEQLENSNYFEFLKILKNRVDTFMQTTTKEELAVLGDNILAFLRAAKNTKLDFSASNRSIFSLIKEVNSPEMRGIISAIVQLINNFDKEKKAISK